MKRLKNCKNYFRLIPIAPAPWPIPVHSLSLEAKERPALPALPVISGALGPTSANFWQFPDRIGAPEMTKAPQNMMCL